MTHLFTDAIRRGRPTMWLLLLTAVVVSIVLACLSAAHRQPWSDEGWFSSPAFNLAQHGVFGTTVIEPAGTHLTRINQRTYWVLPGFLLGQALWYKLFPPTLLWTRAFSITWAPIMLAAFFFLLSSLFPEDDLRAVPWIGTALLALNYVFIDNAGFARPEMMTCAWGFAGIALYLWLRKRSLNAALLTANTCIAVSGMTHPNGVIYLCGLLVVVATLDRTRLKWPSLFSVITPYVILGSLWAGYILQDLAAFRDQILENGTNDRWSKTLNPLAILWSEWRDRYLVVFGWNTGGVVRLKFLELLTYMTAMAALVFVSDLRRRSGVELLLALTISFFAVLSVFNQKLSYYILHIVPLYVAGVSVVAVWAWRYRSAWRWMIAAILGAVVAVDTAGIVLRAVRKSYIASEMPVIEYIRRSAADARLIIGSAALIYDLNFDPRLIDDPYLGTRSNKQADVIVLSSLYTDNYRDWKQTRPAEMAMISRQLASYDLVLKSGEYSVYRRREQSPGVSRGVENSVATP